MPRVRVLDLVTRSDRIVQQDTTYTDEAVRVSRDGTVLLVRRRRLPDGQLEHWLVAADGSASRGLIRYASPLDAADASRYGADPYPSLLDGVAWGRG